eukprot:5931277-Pyramimonas_sp.AAC.1
MKSSIWDVVGCPSPSLTDCPSGLEGPGSDVRSEPLERGGDALAPRDCVATAPVRSVIALCSACC